MAWRRSCLSPSGKDRGPKIPVAVNILFTEPAAGKIVYEYTGQAVLTPQCDLVITTTPVSEKARYCLMATRMLRLV
jgi:hypothetical protein